MEHEIKSIPLIGMRSGIACRSPDRKSGSASDSDPAYKVMTDFAMITPITVEPIVSIDLALNKMKDSGVRLLLVTDLRDNISGVITSHDIQGEKPIKFSRQSGVHHTRIRVENIMTPLENMPAIDFGFVQQALVRHVIGTLKQLNRQHVLVVESDGTDQIIRGMFSTTQISKMLGTRVFDPMQASRSLAAMQMERTHY